jgi:AcrR family transcriptional regulator
MMDKKPDRPGPGRPPSIQDPAGTICNAAAALFAEKGYDGTSLQDVAGLVGVTKAGLYHYFPTKQALYEAIVTTTLRELIQAAEEAVAGAPDHESRLIRFMTAHAGYFAGNRSKYRASFFGRGGDAAEYTAEQLELRRAYAGILERQLEEGVRSGRMTSTDIPSTARGILGMLNWMSRWYRPDGALSAEQIAEGFASTLLFGLIPR